MAPLSFLLAAFLLVGTPAAAQTQSSGYQQRPEVREFIDRMVAEHEFDREELTGLFSEVVKREELFDLLNRPAEKKPWYQYRKIFVTDERASAGVTFWNTHRAWLDKAQRRYGVPPEIIVAIIGVETRYGTYKGRHPVFASLVTLAFDYPKRAAFFERELEQYLLLMREESIDPRLPKGSYAGALGIPQFISSSYLAYAVDFDGNGKRDLWDSPADAIGSVANYFARHGWRPGEDVLRPAAVTGKDWQQVKAGLKPDLTLGELQGFGVSNAGKPLGDGEKLTLITLDLEDGQQHVLGLQNFYVITRYNHSALYAMATWELSQHIRELRDRRLVQRSD